MDYFGKPHTWTRTCKCGATVTVTGYSGPCNMCDACAAKLLAVIFGGTGQAPARPARKPRHRQGSHSR